MYSSAVIDAQRQNYGIGPTWGTRGHMEAYQVIKSDESPFIDYGTIDFPMHHTDIASEFVKVNAAVNKSTIVEHALSSWDLNAKATLVLRVCGTVEEAPRAHPHELLQGVIQAATTSSAWMFCAGLDFGIANLLGQTLGQRRHSCPSPLIGVVYFPSIQSCHQIGLNKKGRKALPGQRRVFCDSAPDQNLSTVSLQPNHTHFVVVDGDESEFARLPAADKLIASRTKGFTFAHQLERDATAHLSASRLLLVMGGDQTTLSEVLAYIEAGHGTVLLASHTGGLAAALSDFVQHNGAAQGAVQLSGGWQPHAATFHRIKHLIQESKSRWPVIECTDADRAEDIRNTILDLVMVRTPSIKDRVIKCVRWNDAARLGREISSMTMWDPGEQFTAAWTLTQCVSHGGLPPPTRMTACLHTRLHTRRHERLHARVRLHACVRSHHAHVHACANACAPAYKMPWPNVLIA